MFAGDNHLFFSNCDIPLLFAAVNSKLSKINQWFLAKKYSLNVRKKFYFSIKLLKNAPYQQNYKGFE